MWQVLLAAAAAAGSGIIAKKFINPNQPVYDSKQNPENSDRTENFQSFKQHSHPQDIVFPNNASIRQSEDVDNGGSIFRFSSRQREVNESKKKIGGGYKKNGGEKKGRKCASSVESWAKGLGVAQRKNWSGKRFSVCLKKRRTGKNSAGKCDSCASKDGSFSWGVGVGIMYMMSSGKAEISRLNTAMDMTAKIVQELKAEISRRKTSPHLHYPISQNQVGANRMHNVKALVLTEEDEGATMEYQQPEVLEMDQLEAELESELQKLPWCATEGSCSDGRTDTSYKTIEFDMEHLQVDHCDSNPMQFNGVLPSELDKKLSHLLIDQQKSEIVELETELQSTLSKLQEKEAELEALKDCVKRLTEFSLASVSDDEINGHTEDEKTVYEEQGNTGFESRKSIVGMKRPMKYEPYSCHPK